MVACQVPLFMGFPRQEYWRGLPFPSPRDLPDPGIQPESPTFPVLAGGFFHTEPPGKPFSSVQFSSVPQSCPTLCDPMNRSTPGLPVHHQLPEFTKLTSIESVMPFSHLILCRPLLLLPPIPPSISSCFWSCLALLSVSPSPPNPTFFFS